MEHGYEIFHPDLRVVVDFYVTVLGFTADGAGEGDRDYVAVERGTLRVGCSRHPDAPLIPRKPPAGSEVVLRVDDVHAEHDRVVATGWPLEDALQERPWGLIDFRLFDPMGQYLRITDAGSRP